MASSAVLIAVRQLDSNHDPMFGNGQANFLTNIDAVAQIIQTSLLLFEGEWWANLNEGLPLFQSILGSSKPKDAEALSLLIQQTIRNVPYVTGLDSIQTIYDPSKRSFQFNCVASTAFGQISISFQPGAAAALPT